jgi:hypothetical protein
MADNNVVTDWAAHFASLPSRPHSYEPGIKPVYMGAPRCSVHFSKGHPHHDIETVDDVRPEELLQRAKDIFEVNAGPEMWVFSHAGSPPWHVPARPKAKRK